MENTLPFSTKLQENLDDLVHRVNMNKASLIIIDGGVGEGKTTLAVHCADYVTKRPIVFDEQLAMGGQDFLKKLRKCYDKRLPIIIYDEGGDFSKRGALTRFNAMMNRTFETFRAFKIIVIICLPSFAVLDSDLYDKDIPRLLLHCQGRTQRQGNFRGYSLLGMMYMRDRMRKLAVKRYAYAIQEPNFYGHFKDLPTERRIELDNFSTKGKLGELRNAEIKLDGLLTIEEIARKVVRSVVYTRGAISKLKIKPQRTVKNRHYYASEAVDTIEDHIDESATRQDKGERAIKGGKL